MWTQYLPSPTKWTRLACTVGGGTGTLLLAWRGVVWRVVWCGAWCGAVCHGVMCHCMVWSAVSCHGAAWRVMWCGVVWHGVPWRGVPCCGVVWHGVPWRGVQYLAVARRGQRPWCIDVHVVLSMSVHPFRCRQGRSPVCSSQPSVSSRSTASLSPLSSPFCYPSNKQPRSTSICTAPYLLLCERHWGRLKCSAHAVQLFGHLALVETHTLWY